MKFQCKKCKSKKELHKIKLSFVSGELICKEAFCCDKYMVSVETKEHEGLPEIRRNDSAINKGDKLWNDFKHDNTEK